jgi:hypothetical protein
LPTSVAEREITKNPDNRRCTRFFESHHCPDGWFTSDDVTVTRAEFARNAQRVVYADDDARERHIFLVSGLILNHFESVSINMAINSPKNLSKLRWVGDAVGL